MHVGSHRLPDLLATLIERGEWKTPLVDRILGIPHQDDRLHFQDLALMQRETNQLVWLCDDQKLGRWYALETGSTRDEVLDPHRAVSIATSHTERGLCLDYRYDPPRVVARDDVRGWVVVAESFDAFWRDYLA